MLKQMTMMIPDKTVKAGVSSVEVFIKGSIDLMEIIAGGYDGTSYCKGVQFGFIGSNLLLKTYEVAVDILT